MSKFIVVELTNEGSLAFERYLARRRQIAIYETGTK